MEKERELAICIIDLFEDLLDKHHINIPNDERNDYGELDTARIFGSDYYTLEDSIVEILKG